MIEIKIDEVFDTPLTEEEQAKAAAFSTMIDIAEKELKISIRKK